MDNKTAEGIMKNAYYGIVALVESHRIGPKIISTNTAGVCLVTTVIDGPLQQAKS